MPLCNLMSLNIYILILAEYLFKIGSFQMIVKKKFIHELQF